MCEAKEDIRLTQGQTSLETVTVWVHVYTECDLAIVLLKSYPYLAKKHIIHTSGVMQSLHNLYLIFGRWRQNQSTKCN